jgi:hypothetical protein
MMRDCPIVYEDKDVIGIISKATEQKLMTFRFMF